MGRTFRARKRKTLKLERDQENLNCAKNNIDFMKWAKKNGLQIKQLSIKPALFPDTGRGAMAIRTIPHGSVVISVPDSLLITTDTVIRSDLGIHIKRSPKELDPIQCISLFLVLEESKGTASTWYPYIQVLPVSYANAAYWTEAELKSLPPWILPIAEEHIRNFTLSYNGVHEFMKKLPLDWRNAVTLERYKWAWSTVNTRAVYWKRPHSPYLKPSKDDCCVLAPVLDMLNHSASADIQAAFNPQNRCYEIKTFTSYPRYSQAFISYGPHDNSKLLVEYGFLLPENPHNVVHFSIVDILQATNHVCSENISAKTKFIYENELHKSISISPDGPSWNLAIVLRVLALNRKEWVFQKSQCLQCGVVSVENEREKKKLYVHLLQWATHQIPLPKEDEVGDHYKMGQTLCYQHRLIIDTCLEHIS